MDFVIIKFFLVHHRLYLVLPVGFLMISKLYLSICCTMCR